MQAIGIEWVEVTCDTCRGSGRLTYRTGVRSAGVDQWGTEDCEDCAGTGERWEPEPVGVREAHGWALDLEGDSVSLVGYDDAGRLVVVAGYDPEAFARALLDSCVPPAVAASALNTVYLGRAL